jgi:diacylglycerol kinase (ATP)
LPNQELFLTSPYHINQNPHKGNRGLSRAWHAAKNSWHGLVYAFQEESAFRQELSLFALLTPIALLLSVSYLEKALLIASLLMVLAIELLNSSVEAAIDRISFEHHDLSKRAKDFGSAAVMLALLIAVLMWTAICIPVVLKP